MEQPVTDVRILWSADLAVGSVLLDEHNRAMFRLLATAADVIAAATPDELAAWLLNTMDQLDALMAAEERELAIIGYPEHDCHRQLHDLARARMQASRQHLARISDAGALAQFTGDTCTGLAVWLMRHVQDADQLFFPYIDQRFRAVSP